jgi:hypothetical protein
MKDSKKVEEIKPKDKVEEIKPVESRDQMDFDDFVNKTLDILNK